MTRASGQTGRHVWRRLNSQRHSVGAGCAVRPPSGVVDRRESGFSRLRGSAVRRTACPPDAGPLIHTFPDADDPESGLGVQTQAGRIVGEDARLHCPDSGRIRRGEQRIEQSEADSAAGGRGVNVDRVFDHAGIGDALRRGHYGNPADDALAGDCDEPMISKPRTVERGPIRRNGIEACPSGI